MASGVGLPARLCGPAAIVLFLFRTRLGQGLLPRKQHRRKLFEYSRDKLHGYCASSALPTDSRRATPLLLRNLPSRGLLEDCTKASRASRVDRAISSAEEAIASGREGSSRKVRRFAILFATTPAAVKFLVIQSRADGLWMSMPSLSWTLCLVPLVCSLAHSRECA